MGWKYIPSELYHAARINSAADYKEFKRSKAARRINSAYDAQKYYGREKEGFKHPDFNTFGIDYNEYWDIIKSAARGTITSEKAKSQIQAKAGRSLSQKDLGKIDYDIEKTFNSLKNR